MNALWEQDFHSMWMPFTMSFTALDVKIEAICVRSMLNFWSEWVEKEMEEKIKEEKKIINMMRNNERDRKKIEVEMRWKRNLKQNIILNYVLRSIQQKIKINYVLHSNPLWHESYCLRLQTNIN